jgi:hypothetical protein
VLKVRFSSILRSHAATRVAARPERGPHVASAAAADSATPVVAPVAVADPEPPDDLDERVRLIGEWQLGEA